MPIVVKVQAVPDPVVAEHQANLLCLVVFGYIEVKLAAATFVVHTNSLYRSGACIGRLTQ